MKKLYRSTTDRMLFGVCGGLGEYLGIDSSMIRILTILGVIFSLSGIFWIYLLLALILPTKE
jgi:phage shock protein PspC (stress-responsive transcriptional regulator)